MRTLDPVWTDIVFDPQTSGGYYSLFLLMKVNRLLRHFIRRVLTVLLLLGTVEASVVWLYALRNKIIKSSLYY